MSYVVGTSMAALCHGETVDLQGIDLAETMRRIRKLAA